MEKNNFYTFIKYINDNQLTISEEDYIEMIYRLCIKEGYTRVKDISDKLNVKPPSVTSMLKKLKNKNLINHESYGIITLTITGNKIGELLLDRHNSIEQFLILIQVKEFILEETEKIEHTLSPDTIFNIKTLVSFFNDNPTILEKYNNYINEKTANTTKWLY